MSNVSSTPPPDDSVFVPESIGQSDQDTLVDFTRAKIVTGTEGTRKEVQALAVTPGPGKSPALLPEISDADICAALGVTSLPAAELSAHRLNLWRSLQKERDQKAKLQEASAPAFTLTKEQFAEIDKLAHERGSIVGSAILALIQLQRERDRLKTGRPSPRLQHLEQTLIPQIEKLLKEREAELKLRTELFIPRPEPTKSKKTETVIRGGMEQDGPEFAEDEFLERCIDRERMHELRLRKHLGQFRRTPLHAHAKTMYDGDGLLRSILDANGLYQEKTHREPSFAKLAAEGVVIADSERQGDGAKIVEDLTEAVQAEVAKFGREDRALWEELRTPGLLPQQRMVQGFEYCVSDAGITINPRQGYQDPDSGHPAANITVRPEMLATALLIFRQNRTRPPMKDKDASLDSLFRRLRNTGK
jgi:hypothetical protein